ncbi:MAG: hypothetical protein EP146_00630 [Oscillibacter sp.]|nr:hypothetical protein [Oscillibacter sp.]
METASGNSCAAVSRPCAPQPESAAAAIASPSKREAIRFIAANPFRQDGGSLSWISEFPLKKEEKN